MRHRPTKASVLGPIIAPLKAQLLDLLLVRRMRGIIVAIHAAAAVAVASAAGDVAEKECAKRMVDDVLRTHICHIHHIRLRKLSVPVDETFPKTPDNDAYHRAEICRFPHACLFATNSRGDSVELPPPTHRDALVCKGCFRAQREWAVAHPKTEWGRFILSHQTSNHAMQPTASPRTASLFDD